MGVGGVHGRGAGGGPRHWVGSGFFAEFNQAAPSGDSLPGFTAGPCCAFRRFLAVPPAHPCCAFRLLPALRSREGGSGWWRAVPVVRGVLGHPAPYGLAGRGAGGGAVGDGFGIFTGNSTRLRLAVFLCRAFRQIPAALSSASVLCLTAHPCRAFQRFPALRLRVVAWGGGDSGCLWESGVSRARGHGNAGGAAWEWAEPAAGERSMSRDRRWVRDFSGNSTMLRLLAFLCRASRQIPLPRFPALRCCASWHIPAAPSDVPRLCPRHIPAAPFGAAMPFGSEWGQGVRLESGGDDLIEWPGVRVGWGGSVAECSRGSSDRVQQHPFRTLWEWSPLCHRDRGSGEVRLLRG